MWSSLTRIQHTGEKARQFALASAVLALSVLPYSRAQAQACAAGPLANYINPNGPNSCTIAGITLTWAQYGGIVGNPTNVNVTPLTGTNANGSYFGFRLTSAIAAPLVSASIVPAEARVHNPSYDPNDPLQGPEFFPYLQPTDRSGFLGWRFTHSLTAANAITRLELQTRGTRASSTSQAPIQPSYLLNGEPDVNTGCGWSIYDPNNNQTYDAKQKCGFFEAVSNNFLWREISDNKYAQTVWSSSGQYRYPDYANGYCQENGLSVQQPGSDCTSYQDMTGVNFGTFVALGFSQSANAMRRFAPLTDTGLIDPDDPNYANYGASASLDDAEFRIYYQPSNVVPEPGTWALMATGLLLLLGVARRQRSLRG